MRICPQIFLRDDSGLDFPRIRPSLFSVYAVAEVDDDDAVTSMKMCAPSLNSDGHHYC